MKAVETLVEHRSITWFKGTFPSAIQPSKAAIKEANRPSTVAWSYGGREIFKNKVQMYNRIMQENF